MDAKMYAPKGFQRKIFRVREPEEGCFEVEYYKTVTILENANFVTLVSHKM